MYFDALQREMTDGLCEAADTCTPSIASLSDLMRSSRVVTPPLCLGDNRTYRLRRSSIYIRDQIVRDQIAWKWPFDFEVMAKMFGGFK